jgi:signal transduction histidine kinase
LEPVPFREINDPVKLRRVLEATLLLEADLDLAVLLRHIVEEARSITHATYGALGVLTADGNGLSEFVTAGMDLESEERIGARPKGLGILGVLITDPRPLRMANIGGHPGSFGFPPDHPPMQSFLGVPVMLRGEVFGNLYLTDKIGWSEFSRDDELLVGSLAVAAGIAIENAQLHQRVREAAVFEDRDRMARDLHDTVIQRLFGAGLTLQGIASTARPDVSERIIEVIDQLDATIRQVRSTIFELGQAEFRQGARSSVLHIVRELELVLGFRVELSVEGPIDTTLPERVSENMTATLREALTNVGRHAGATKVRVELSARNGVCRLVVVDDGHGIVEGTSSDEGGNGLVNMRRRAEKLFGTLDVLSTPGVGTSIIWQVPLAP